MSDIRQLFQRRLATVDERYPDAPQRERDWMRGELAKVLKLINGMISEGDGETLNRR